MSRSRESGVGIHQPTCSARGELEETLNHEHKHKYKQIPAERKEGKKSVWSDENRGQAKAPKPGKIRVTAISFSQLAAAKHQIRRDRQKHWVLSVLFTAIDPFSISDG